MAGLAKNGTTSRTGVILAAGFGSRLAGVDPSTRLKPLTPVAGTPLIVRTLQSLERAGCQRVVIVLGYKPEVMQSGIESVYDGSLDLVFTVNEQYQLSNGLSVLAARPFVEGPFVLTMADHVFGEEVMELARKHMPAPGHATLLVDSKIDTIFDMDDATKVQVEDSKVQSIGKKLTAFNAIDTGIFICTDGLMDALAHIHAQKGNASLSDGVQHLAAAGRMDTLDIGDGFWQDVDTPEMLAHATALLEERESVAP